MSEGIPADVSGFRIGFAAGLRIAGYRLDREIGRGSVALVYRAREERPGRLVALKILAPELADDETFRQWFIQQLRAVAEVDNPHLLPVFEAGEADGMLFIAMRYVPGGDARSLLRREGQLPLGRVAAIISQTASGLDAMHAAGLLHRDVKPTNILVHASHGRPDQVYLSDFGLSSGAVSVSGPARTRSSMNTLACASPELIQGNPADGRADQYSLAATAFELLTGWPPFRPGDARALLQAHVSQPPPRLTSRRPELPPGVDSVLVKALAKSPGQRYAHCRDFAAALAGALGLRPPGPGLIQPRGLQATGPAAGAVRLAGPDSSPRSEAPTAGVAAAEAPGPALRVGGGEPWLVRREPKGRRVPLIVAALATVAVLAVTSAVVIATGVLRSPPPKPIPKLASFPIAARSALPLMSGDAWVIYHSANAAQAQVYGEVKGATRGDIARLYAQPFPYGSAAVPVASVALHPKGKLASYAFPVTPSLATRYHVKVFHGRAGVTSLASSPATTVYVAAGVTRGAAQKCARPTCRQSLPVDVFVPASALSAEMSKPWYTYFGLNLSKTAAKPPAPPAVLPMVASAGHVSAPKQVAADEFAVTVTFAFSIGKADGYGWAWSACTQDTAATDGLGLPGPHECGDKTIPAGSSYLG